MKRFGWNIFSSTVTHIEVQALSMGNAWKVGKFFLLNNLKFGVKWSDPKIDKHTGRNKIFFLKCSNFDVEIRTSEFS